MARVARDGRTIPALANLTRERQNEWRDFSVAAGLVAAGIVAASLGFASTAPAWIGPGALAVGGGRDLGRDRRERADREAVAQLRALDPARPAQGRAAPRE